MRTGETTLSAAPFAGHGRPRAASDTEDTPMIQKLASDSAEGVGLTSSALKAQQRQLSGRKKLSSMLGFGDKKKKTGLFGGSRGTRSVDQNRTALEQERGKDKEKMKQLERESLSEISNNTKLLKVAIARFTTKYDCSPSAALNTHTYILSIITQTVLSTNGYSNLNIFESFNMLAVRVGCCSARTRDHPQRGAALRDYSQGGGQEVRRTGDLLHTAALPPL